MHGWQVVGSALGAGALLWLSLIGVVATSARRAGGRTDWRAAVRLLPDVVRLCRRLGADRRLPRGVRVRLWLLLGYLLSPVDLVPDVLPLIGYADDAILVAMTLRSVVRRAGAEALHRHWPGTPAGLDVVLRLAGVPVPVPGDGRPTGHPDAGT